MWPVFLSSLMVLFQERNISNGIDPTEQSPNAASMLTIQKTAALQTNGWTSPESPSVDSGHPRSDWRTSPTMNRLSRSKPSHPSGTGAANPMSPNSPSKVSTPTNSSSSSPLTRDSSSGGCLPPIGWSSLSPKSTSRERSSSPNSRPRQRTIRHQDSALWTPSLGSTDPPSLPPSWWSSHQAPSPR